VSVQPHLGDLPKKMLGAVAALGGSVLMFPLLLRHRRDHDGVGRVGRRQASAASSTASSASIAASASPACAPRRSAPSRRASSASR
jgi:hypothetical protein